MSGMSTSMVIDASEDEGGGEAGVEEPNRSSGSPKLEWSSDPSGPLTPLEAGCSSSGSSRNRGALFDYAGLLGLPVCATCVELILNVEREGEKVSSSDVYRDGQMA